MNNVPNKAKVLRHEACPKCRKRGRDNTGDNLAIYLDESGEESAHCFSCKFTIPSSEYKNDNYETRYNYEMHMSGELTTQGWDNLKNMTAIDPSGWRGLSKDVCNKYGVRHQYDEDGSIKYQYYPITKQNELCGVKWRSADKKWNNRGSADSTCDLFGQVSFMSSSKRAVIISSGEIDALSIYKALYDYNNNSGKNWETPPVVCGVAGEGSYRQYQNHYDWLDSFDKIYVCPDQDEPGREHLEKVVNVLPRNKVLIMDLPYKDANECLQKNKPQVIVDSYFKARSYTPSGIIGSDVLKDALLEGIRKTKIPLPPFLNNLSEMLRGGIRLPSIVNIVGPTGIGKSSYVNELIYFWIKNSPYMVGILSLEADRSEYANVIASKHLQIKLNLLHDDEAEQLLLREDTQERLDDLFTKEDGSPRFYLMEERDGKLENIKKLIEKMIISCDCKIIVIDPIQDLFAGLSIGEQEEFSAWLKVTIKAYGVCFICINHIRKAQGGGTEARYSETEVKGSSTIIQSSFLTILLNREKDPDPTLSKNEQRVLMSTMTHRVSKNRATGETGDAGDLFYDAASHTLYDIEEYKTINPELFATPSESDY